MYVWIDATLNKIRFELDLISIDDCSLKNPNIQQTILLNVSINTSFLEMQSALCWVQLWKVILLNPFMHHFGGDKLIVMYTLILY